MMGGSETVSGDKDGVHTTAIHVPIGWQRRVEGGHVIYVSPSGTALTSLDEVKTYLLSDGTCKCGLECPLVIHKVFNFTVGVKVEQHSQPLGKTEQDMTKLCNHRRKVVAMAALCRSMQVSQLPFANLCHPDMSTGVDNRDPKRALVEREEEEHGIYHPKLHPPPARPHGNLHPNPCVSPKSSHQFVYPYNGSSPGLHTGTNSHHPLEALRRLHHPPPLPVSSSSPSNSSFPVHSNAQRSPRTPTPQNVSQGQRTPKTPDTPGSPRLVPLSSPPSPMNMGGGGRGAQTHHHHHGVIVGGSPLSPSPSPTSSVHNMNRVSPHQRSRHPSASPSPLSEQGAGGGLMGSNLSQRRKSTSSSPHSPLSSGSPSPHFPKYKLEDILEQFRNSGGSSTNNHHILIPTNPSLLTNQSSSIPQAVSSKPSKTTVSPTPSSGPPGFEFSSAGPSSLPLGPFLNHHHSHQSKLPQPGSFPASSLLSAAAKAQLANQITQGQSSNVASTAVSLPSSLEVLKETQQQQPSSKVTNSTLRNNHPPSSSASSRPPHPSLASASSVLLPPSHSLAQSLASSLPHLPPTAERNASHRKRQRRSPTVLSMLRDTQQLVNGPRKTPPGDAAPATAINLSSSSSSASTSCSSSHSSSTSAVQSQNAVTLENHLLPGQPLRLPTSRQIAHHSRPPRQTEALDFTTQLTQAPLGLDPPTQPLSALLHLLSVQNAQANASASISASAQPGSVSMEGGSHTNKQSPRLSPPSPSLHSSVRHQQTRSPCRTSHTTPFPSVAQPLSPPSSTLSRPLQSPLHPQSTKSSPLQRLSPSSTVLTNSSSASHNPSSPTHSDKQQKAENHLPTIDSVSQAPSREASPQSTVARDSGSNSISTSVDLSHSQSSVSMAISSSPKPLDLSNHVLALLAASSSVPQGDASSSDHATDVLLSSQGNPMAGSEESRCVDTKVSTMTKPAAATSPGPAVSSGLGDNNGLHPSLAVGDSATPLPLAEAFPFMNQEQLLQLLSSTGGLPSLLDPAVLASLPLGGLWLGGQHAPIPPASASQQNLAEQQQQSEQQQQLLMQQESQQQSLDQQQKQQINGNPLFPLLPLLSGTQGELPLNLLGLLNPLPAPASTPNPGQEPDLGLAEKPSLQALLMASLLLGQQQAPLLPLSGLAQLNQVSLEVPLQQPQQIPTTLEGLTLDKASGLLDPSALPAPGLLEVAQGLLSIPPGAEGPLQALQSLLLPATLPPPAAFLPLSPALLTAALSSAELHPPPHTHLAPAQQTQHPQPQVSSDAGVEALIPLSVQGKDNPILQHLLPSLLNPAVLGDLSAVTGVHSMLGVGAGSILLPQVQASALGMPLLQGPDGAISLLNNIQLNLAPPSDGDKPVSEQEAESPGPQEDIPTSQIAPEVAPSPAPAPAPGPPQEPSPPPQRVSESRSVIDPYTSFMDTIYTSFLQVSAKEQEDRAHLGPSDPTSPFCALPPVSFPVEHHTPSTPAPPLPQASAPVSLSPRRACSLRNPDLSRLSLEAAAHSPAQGTPKPTEDGSMPPLQRKPAIVEGHTHPEPPLPPIYLEEAKTDCTGPTAAVCPYVEAGADRQGHIPLVGYLSPRDGCSGRQNEETAGTLLHSEQGRDQAGAAGGARRGRKRKQTLQNVLEDFRDMDPTALEETKASTALLKPERSVRGRRRRGARSQRQ